MSDSHSPKTIHTAIHQGFAIPEEVRLAVEGNSCMLAVTESQEQGQHDFMFDAWGSIFDDFEGDILVGMENRLVITEGCVDELLACLDTCDLAMYSTVGGIYNMVMPNDAFFAVRRRVIDAVPFTRPERGCPLCEWILAVAAAGYQVKYATAKMFAVRNPVEVGRG